jgi:AcrR family transcriptional regulator
VAGTAERTGARRDEIVECLADYLLAQGLGAASLRPMARAAGLSDRMLLYYFKDKAEAIAAALDRVAARMTARLAAEVQAPLPLPDLQRRLADLVLAPAFWPYMQLWLEMTALAARGDPFYRSLAGAIAQGFLDWGAAQLDCPDDASRVRDPARLVVTLEGMLLLTAVGLGDTARQALSPPA